MATWIAEPLLTLLLVMIAVSEPVLTGLVEKVTTRLVAVAEVTVPTAPLLKTTVLFAAVVLKPNPLIVIVLAVRARLLVLAVITGRMLATCTAAPLDVPLVVTIAVNEPEVVGLVVKVTISDVAVEEVTVPTAPLLKTTVLLPAVLLKPVPVIVTVLALAFKLPVLLLTLFATAATCTAAPLLTPEVVTTAVRLPAAGLVENVTVNEVAVAAVTVPTAPLLNTTVLLAAVVLNPVPAMVIVAAAFDRFAVLLVTVGVTVAT